MSESKIRVDQGYAVQLAGIEKCQIAKDFTSLTLFGPTSNGKSASIAFAEKDFNLLIEYAASCAFASASNLREGKLNFFKALDCQAARISDNGAAALVVTFGRAALGFELPPGRLEKLSAALQVIVSARNDADSGLQ